MLIIKADFSDRRVLDLLQNHLTRARSGTAPGSAHALDLAGLQLPGIQVWAIRKDEMILGLGALNCLSLTHGEVKSMYIDQTVRRIGAGSVMLRHIVAVAQARGISRLSLETGSSPYFQAARNFYKAHGFVECEPFAQYVPDPNSVFMSLDLTAVAVAS